MIQKFRILDPQKFLTENNRFIVRPIECLTRTFKYFFNLLEHVKLKYSRTSAV